MARYAAGTDRPEDSGNFEGSAYGGDAGRPDGSGAAAS